MYRTLDPAKIILTLERLERRIAERFPGAGLCRVCAELIAIARETAARISDIARPTLWLRALTAAILLCGLGLLGYVTGSIIEIKRGDENLVGVLQGLEAFINILVLTGAAVLFVVTLEARWKRRRALEDLHELHSIMHVIDMHQLTKDPSTAAAGSGATASSPARVLTPFELTRYLDYCSELLSLAAKVAALYAQSTKDPVVIEAASDLAQIASHLSNKIWQKINIVQTGGPQHAMAAPAYAASGGSRMA
jgi:hypothetical protein